MKIYEITETRTDEVAPIAGGLTVGAAIAYILSALAAGLTLWDYIEESEAQGSFDPTTWDDETKVKFFGEVAIGVAFGVAGKAIGWAVKSVKGFKGAAKAMSGKDLAKKTQKIQPTISDPTKLDDLAKDIYGRTEPTISIPKVEKPRYRSNPDGSITRIK